MISVFFRLLETILLLSLVSCQTSNSSNTKDVSNVQLMEMRDDGRFDINCKDSRVEIRTASEVTNNDVCNTDQNRDGPIQCRLASNGKFTLNRSRDGAHLGDPNASPSRDNCLSIAESSEFTTCIPSRIGGYFLADVDGKLLGDYGSRGFENCMNAMAKSSKRLACAPSRFGSGVNLTKVATNEKIGELETFDQCIKSINPLSSEVTCSRKTGEYYPTRIRDLKHFGEAMTAENCHRSLEKSKLGMICIKQSRGFRALRGINGKVVGDSMDFESCLKVTTNARKNRVCALTGRAYSVFNITTGDEHSHVTPTTLDACVNSL